MEEKNFEEMSVSTLFSEIEKTAKELGKDIKIISFVRFEKGEGIEKRVDDFAAEVASMIK